MKNHLKKDTIKRKEINMKIGKNTALIYRAMNEGCKTVSDLAKYLKGV